MAEQYDVTSVGVNPAKDRAYRMRMYFLTMTLRVLCIVSLFWVRGPWVILVGAGAVLLPYFAVLIANAVSHQGGDTPDAPGPLEIASHEASPVDMERDTGVDLSTTPLIVVDAPAERRSTDSGATA